MQVDLEKFDWETFLSKTNTLTMWYKSSGSFLNRYKSLITDIVKRGNVTAIIPNFQNENLMNSYTAMYPTQYTSSSNAQSSIYKTLCLLKEIGATVYLHDGLIHYPAYVTDTEYLFGLHEFGKVKNITSPCFVCKKDGFVQSQVMWLVDNSIHSW